MTPAARNEIAAAGAVNADLYTAWFHGGEEFGQLRSQLTLNGPETSPQFGLPSGIGHIKHEMDQETKSSATIQADMSGHNATRMLVDRSTGSSLFRIDLEDTTGKADGKALSRPLDESWINF